MLGKDIKNKLGAVYDLAFGDVSQIVQLRGRKLAVKYQHARPALQGQHLKFRHLAPAHDKTRVHLGHALHHASGHGQAGGARQFAQFVQIALLNDAGHSSHGNQQNSRAAVRLLGVFGPAGQFFFQRFGRVCHVGCRAIPGAWLVKMVGLTVDAGGQQVRRLPLHGVAHGIDRKRDDGVQPQEEHIHEVFLADAAGGQVRVQETQAAQAFVAAAASGQFRNQYAARLAHNDHLHAALAVYEQANLPSYGA